MKAIIVNNEIIKLISDTANLINYPTITDNGRTFQVSSIGEYLVINTTETCVSNLKLVDGILTVIPTPPKEVPASITKVQAMRAMKQNGTLWTDFNTILASNIDAKDEWDLALELQRNHPLITTLGVILGLTDLKLDELFILGGEL